jgi:glycosyltransferase involved in cell wall biosynthesis
MKNTLLRKVLISDWFEKFGGAEKVVQAINEIFQFDQYYAYIDKMPSDIKTKVFGENVVVKDSYILNKFSSCFRLLMPFFPIIVKMYNWQNRKENFDLIISSSWALSKGFKLKGAKHICYLQARNFKYVWDEADLYFNGPLKLFSFVKYFLRKFDINSAQNPDLLISNSKFVQAWTKSHYNRDSIVVYPPVEVEDFYISEEKGDYYITIGRLEPYKRFDIIIDAFNKNKKNLLVLGSGSQLGKLKKNANNNIQFLGFKPKEEVENILSKSKAFVYAGVEDFGIVYAESLASGVPVIAYNGGAVGEIVDNLKDGVLYNNQEETSLNSAIKSFEQRANEFFPEEIKERANRFSKLRFQKEFKEIVEDFMFNSSNKA